MVIISSRYCMAVAYLLATRQAMTLLLLLVFFSLFRSFDKSLCFTVGTQAQKGRALLHPAISAAAWPHSHRKGRRKNGLLLGGTPQFVQDSLYTQCSSAIPTARRIGMGTEICRKNQLLPKMHLFPKLGNSPGCSAVLVNLWFLS